MATPKKKHLIELMIEARVKWPEGAEYVTQDKSTLKIHFYKGGKPIRSKRNNEAWSDAVSMCTWMGNDISIELPSLCHNWHQTIVTRSQYAKAIAAADNEEKEQQPQLHSGVTGVIPTKSIESLLSEIKAKREEHNVITAKAKALTFEITSIEQQVNDKLNEYGFVMSPITTSSEQGQSVITDWHDLRIGDVVECVDYDSDKEGVIIGIDNEDEDQPIKVKRYASGIAWPSSWKFIRRP